MLNGLGEADLCLCQEVGSRRTAEQVQAAQLRRLEPSLLEEAPSLSLLGLLRPLTRRGRAAAAGRGLSAQAKPSHVAESEPQRTPRECSAAPSSRHGAATSSRAELPLAKAELVLGTEMATAGQSCSIQEGS